jgi:hypothetical protein
VAATIDVNNKTTNLETALCAQIFPEKVLALYAPIMMNNSIMDNTETTKRKLNPATVIYSAISENTKAPMEKKQAK